VLRTPLCDLLGIEQPIMSAPFGPWDQVELAAAVSNAGGIGSVGTAARGVDELREQWERLRSLTDRPFAINHTVRPFNPEAFDATLDFAPPAISFHMAVDGALIEQAHARGIQWIQQVVNRDQAVEAVAAGADVVIAQGGEAGGHAGFVSTMVLVPEVVDVAGSVPVMAAGGIADGRGLAAALVLGAQGVNMGTRFIASEELAVSDEWKQLVVDSGSEDAVKVENTERALSPYSREVPPIVPRAFRTPLVDRLASDPESVVPEEIGPEFIAAILDGRGHEYMPFAGQSAGLVHEVLPVTEILARVVTEAETALRR